MSKEFKFSILLVLLTIITLLFGSCSQPISKKKIPYELIEITNTSKNGFNMVLGYDGIIKIDSTYYSASFNPDTALLYINQKLFKINEK